MTRCLLQRHLGAEDGLGGSPERLLSSGCGGSTAPRRLCGEFHVVGVGGGGELAFLPCLDSVWGAGWGGHGAAFQNEGHVTD